MMRAMRIMMTLQGDAPIDEIDAYLAAQGATVLGSERLDPTEGATISASGDEPPLVDREGLKPSGKGTRIRRMAKQRFVVDGPFTESKELVGGYMIVQARSLDEAVDLIRPWLRIHRIGQGVPFSAIEVRRLT